MFSRLVFICWFPFESIMGGFFFLSGYFLFYKVTYQVASLGMTIAFVSLTVDWGIWLGPDERKLSAISFHLIGRGEGEIPFRCGRRKLKVGRAQLRHVRLKWRHLWG